MRNPKIGISFEDRILSVKFHENAVVTAADLMDLYAFATGEAKGFTYGVIFEAAGHYEVTEEAIQYMSKNPYQKCIFGKVYVVNSMESDKKTRLHLLFDKPELKPYTFKTFAEGLAWLKTLL